MTTRHLPANKAADISSSPSTRGQGGSPQGRPCPPPPSRIAVGVDGTPSGRDAVVLASLLGQRLGAELMLVSIYEEPPPLAPAEIGWKSEKEQTRASLVKTRELLAPGARMVVQAGVEVWRSLRIVVRHEHRDLLVLGPAQKAQHGKVRLGDTGRDLLYRLECPLALAPRDMRKAASPRLARIGIGFDGEPEAWAAFELAASIAGAADAELELRGVVDDRVPGGLRTEQIVLGGEEIVDRQIDSLMERALAAAHTGGVPTGVQVGPGDPSEALRTLAAQVDLLVIGSKSSATAGRVSLGSVASAVTDGAPCPILIAPKPRDASTA